MRKLRKLWRLSTKEHKNDLSQKNLLIILQNSVLVTRKINDYTLQLEQNIFRRVYLDYCLLHLSLFYWKFFKHRSRFILSLISFLKVFRLKIKFMYDLHILVKFKNILFILFSSSFVFFLKWLSVFPTHVSPLIS